MCGILDANTAGLVFGKKNMDPEIESPSMQFYNWLNMGRGSLVAGGKLLLELDRVSMFAAWRKQAMLSGRIRILNKNEVDREVAQIEKKCRSDDSHVVAVARLSGARLLYSHDGDLQQDFKDKDLIDNPRGKVYTDTTTASKRLLRQKNLCRRDARV